MKLRLGQSGNKGPSGCPTEQVWGIRMHKPAVTLTFTLMGKRQVRGNETGMREQDKESCLECQSLEVSALLPWGLARDLPRPERPWYLWCLGPSLQAHKSELSPFSFLCPLPLDSGTGRAWPLGIC